MSSSTQLKFQLGFHMDLSGRIDLEAIQGLSTYCYFHASVAMDVHRRIAGKPGHQAIAVEISLYFISLITNQMPKDTYLKKVLGDKRLKAIHASKVLMVGAGGIGCELLKNLVLSGFGEIHIVDLDTITLSNLNRQFLFRQKDIGQLKSLTVCTSVEKFNFFGAKLQPHHGNVMDVSLFPIEWWAQFDYVFNALDNLEARRYVNSICLFLRKPLMESGTTGFDGQIQPIYPYATECFECQPKATPTVYPVCTIRSTPSQPVHCIVWAKEFLFNHIFNSSIENEVSPADLSKETSDPKEVQRILLEANELLSLKKMINDEDFPIKFANKLFNEDIMKALELESLWKTREKPQPLDVYDLYREVEKLLQERENESILKLETQCWSLQENLYVFYSSVKAIQQRLQTETDIEFDKDDEDTLNFVAAASNLRSHNFHIEPKTKFDIKQIAGNIIPAIATTNAIISGLSDLASLNSWLENFCPMKSKSSFLSNKENRRAISVLPERPKPTCASCGMGSKGIMSLSPKDLEMTLENLLQAVRNTYSFKQVSVILGKNKLIHDLDFDDNVAKKLKDIPGFLSNQTLLFQDEDDELENLELLMTIGENLEFELPSIKVGPKKLETNHKSIEADTTMIENVDTEEPIVIEDDGEPPTKKRRKTQKAAL